MKLPKDWSMADLKVLCKAMLAGDKEAIGDFWSHFSGLFVMPDGIRQEVAQDTRPFPAWVYRLAEQ